VQPLLPVGPSLAWTHAQYLRLAWDLQDGRVSETPDVVAARYASTK
jgi:glucoamylase